MAIKQFNSVEGYSVGSTPSSVIDANGNVSGNAITATANITAPRLISNVATGTAPLTVTSTTRVANLNVNYANVADFISVAAGTGNNFIIFANAATGNITELTSTGLIANLSNNSITATTFVGALSGAATSATTAGTVTTAAQPNITSVGTLTSLGVTGNISAGNVNLSGAITNGSSSIVFSNTSVGLAANGFVRVTATDTGATVTGTLGVSQPVTSSRFISNIATGTAPLTVSSNTLVANLNADLLDGFNTATANTANTVAVRDTNGNLSANFFIGNGSQLTGITVAAGSSIVNGTSNVNIPSSGGNINISVGGTANTAIFSTSGITSNGTNAFLATGTAFNNVALGMLSANASNGANMAIRDFSSVSSTMYLDVSVGGTANGSFIFRTTNSFSTLVAISNLGLTLSTGVFIGNGNSLSSLQGANVSGQVGNALVAGTVYTAAQPNITSVGTLTSLAVTGNITGGNLIGPHANGNSNVNIPAANGNVNISAVGNANILVVTGTGANITGTANVTGNLSAGNITTGSGTGGNISGANVITANTFVGALTGAATTAGTVTTAAQPNITSVGTLTSVAVTGNANVGNLNATTAVVASTLTSNVATGTAPLTVTSTTRVANLNVAQANVADFIGVAAGTGNNFLIFANAATGNVTELTSTGLTANLSNNSITATTFVGALSGAATSATTAGTVTTAAQPNITSTGTLTSLGVTGNITAGNANVTGQLISTVATGTAPLVVASTTRVTNLNADFLGGLTTDTAGSNNTIVARTGNGQVVGNTLLSSIATGTAPLVVTSTTRVANLNVAYANVADNINVAAGTGNNFLIFANAATGNVAELTSTGLIANLSNNSITATTFVGALSGAATSATTAGTVTTAAQPNITSVGTLTSLGVSGTVTAPAFTANTGIFTGNGSGLSAIAGANVTGTVSSATSAASATTAGTVTTAAQPNITSVGTLTSLGVSGTVTAPAFTANTGVFTGNGSALTALNASNISTGTLAQARLANSNVILGSTTLALGTTTTTIAGLSSVTSTTFVGALTGAATTAGTVTTAAQPNITSVGTLTSATVTGNVAAGNLTTTGVLSVTGTGVSSIAGNLDMTSNTIINLATPTNATDAATKQYVDDVAQGLHTHDSCNAATQTTLATISGGTVTYNNGTSGVGATLTTTGTYTTIDGVTLSNGMRILVKSEANTAHNGIYDRTSTTVLTRSDDFNTPTEMAGGDFTFVTAGTLYDNTGWVMPDPVTTVGTSAVVWIQFSGAGTYTAGTGLTLTGSQFSVNASQTQVTAVGTLTGLNSSGTITAPAFTANTGIFTGNGSALTALNASNVSSGTLAQARLANSNVVLGNTTLELGSTTTTVTGLTSVTSTTFVGALTGAATTAGTVTTAAQPNITSVGTLTSLGVSGTVTAPAFTANTGVFTGNGSGLSAIAGANVTGTVASATSAGSATTAGTVTTAAQPNITSVGTLTGLGVNGTITGVNITANTGVFTGNGAALTTLNASNVSSGTLAQARLANASVTLGSTALTLGSTVTTVAGLSSVTSTTFVGALTGAATTAGTVTTAAQPNITSVGTLTSLGVSGAVTASTLTSNVATGTQPLTVTSTTKVANLNVEQVDGYHADITSTVSNIAVRDANANLYANNYIGTTFTSNVATGTAPIVVTSTTRVSNLNVAYANVADNINVAAGTGNNFLIFANAATGNVAELTSTGLTANLSNNSITATTFVGALSGAATSATTAGTVTTAAQPNITSVGTLTSLGVNGTVTAVAFTANTGIFTGNGSALTALNASNVSSGTLAQARLANASVTLGSTALTLGSTVTTVAGLSSVTSTTFVGALTGAATTAGTVTTAAQPNITSVGTLTGLTVSGAVSITNSTAATSRTTGALIVTGGIGANANSFFTNLNVTSNIAYVAPNGANTINSTMLNGGTLAWSGNAGQLFSITDSMTGNIFTVNDVSGIPMISVDAGGNIQFAASGGFVSYGVTTGITAAGSTQGTATALTRPINVVSTVSASTGVILPTVPAGARILVMNTSGTALNVYPPSGAAINSAATNAAYSQPAGARLEFVSVSATQWYTLNATYG